MLLAPWSVLAQYAAVLRAGSSLPGHLTALLLNTRSIDDILLILSLVIAAVLTNLLLVLSPVIAAVLTNLLLILSPVIAAVLTNLPNL
jgi:hypothetical protein